MKILDRLLELANQGEMIPDIDMLKTPEQIEGIKTVCLVVVII